MNALVIGAGAIGQVIGYHLQKGGSQVTFFARSERAQHIKNGLVLFHLNKRNSRRRPINFESFEVFSEYSGIEDQEWDQIYFCIPSDALSDSLLEGVSERSGEATIIKLQPGLGDYRIYKKHFEESHLVSGMLSFMSYAAPLPQEHIEQPGIAYWLPPLLSIPFSGSTIRVRAVVKALNNGGLRARVHDDVERLVGFALALQAPLTAGLECSRWSIQEYRASPTLKVVCRAIKEATAIVSNTLQSDPPKIMKLLNCSLIRVGLSFLPRRYPFNMEHYLVAHYKKLHEQSCKNLDDYIEQGQKMDLPHDSLLELREGLDRF